MRTIKNTIAKAFFIALSMFVGTSVHADWKKVVGSRGGTVYTDAAGKQRQGDTVKMWSLTDYKQPQAFKKIVIYSDKSWDEYDCKGRRIRVLHTEAYSDRMGNGTVVHRDTSTSPWLPVASGDSSEMLWKIACDK